MITFCLVLSSPDYEGFLARIFKLPILPRKGELVNLAGEALEVSEIYHNIDGIPEVWIRDVHEYILCDAYLAFADWELDGFIDEEERDFKKAVKVRKKVQKTLK